MIPGQHTSQYSGTRPLALNADSSEFHRVIRDVGAAITEELEARDKLALELTGLQGNDRRPAVYRTTQVRQMTFAEWDQRLNNAWEDIRHRVLRSAGQMSPPQPARKEE
jgi:hypothetical protein